MAVRASSFQTMKGAPSCCFLILLAAAVAQGDNCKKPAGQPLPPGQCWNDAAYVLHTLALKPYDNLTYTLHTHALNISYALKHTPLLLSSSKRTVATTAFTVSIAVHSLSTNANIDDCRNKIAGYDSSPTSEWCCGKCSTTANCTTWVQWRPHNIDDAGSAKVQQTVGMWECTLTTRVGL